MPNTWCQWQYTIQMASLLLSQAVRSQKIGWASATIGLCSMLQPYCCGLILVYLKKGSLEAQTPVTFLFCSLPVKVCRMHILKLVLQSCCSFSCYACVFFHSAYIASCSGNLNFNSILIFIYLFNLLVISNKFPFTN